MSRIVIRNLSKWYDEGVEALKNIDLFIDDGEFLVLLGPSGCGKTTTLRCIAGLENPTDGELEVDDSFLYSSMQGIDVPPRERNIGFVFQNYALYPHMTVYNNIAFPLKTRGLDSKSIIKRVEKVIELVGLNDLSDRHPGQLSGGQQQRVALARVLVNNPRILLFDEPLSNLDVKLRAGLRAEIRKTHARIGATSIYVTHDQAEAMTIGDRIAVMNSGVILQIGKPGDIYHFPQTAFVAAFTGNPQTNLVRGRIRREEGHMKFHPEADPASPVIMEDECGRFNGQQVILNIRPEDVELIAEPEENDLTLEVFANLNQGSETLVYLRFRDGVTEFLARGRVTDYIGFRYGHKVGVRFHRGNVFDPSSERIIGSFGFGAPSESGVKTPALEQSS